MSANSGPGWKKHPDHRITAVPTDARVVVTARGEVVADSADAIRLEEQGYPVRYYLPRQDVRMEQLARSNHQSHCPFKGQASYYSLHDGPQNIAWSYETPYDEMEIIKGRLAFYADKVDAITVG